MFGVEQRRLRGAMMAAFEYLKDCHVADGAKLLRFVLEDQKKTPMSLNK